MDLQYLADEGDWPYNRKFTVFDNKGDVRQDLMEKNIEFMIFSHPEFYKIENENSKNYGKYTLDGNRLFNSLDDLVKYAKKNSV